MYMSILNSNVKLVYFLHLLLPNHSLKMPRITGTEEYCTVQVNLHNMSRCIRRVSK